MRLSLLVHHACIAVSRVIDRDGPALAMIADRESKEAHSNTNYTAMRTSPETRDQAAQTVPYETCRAKQMEQAAQALAVTVQYLAYEVCLFRRRCPLLTLRKEI